MVGWKPTLTAGKAAKKAADREDGDVHCLAFVDKIF